MANENKSNSDRSKLKSLIKKFDIATNPPFNLSVSEFQSLLEKLSLYYSLNDHDERIYFCTPLQSMGSKIMNINNLEKTMTEFFIINALYSNFTYLNASTNSDDDNKKPRFNVKTRTVTSEPSLTPVLWSANSNASLINDRQIKTGRDHIVFASKIYPAFFTEMALKLFDNKSISDALIRFSTDAFSSTLSHIFGGNNQVFDFKIINTSCLLNKMYSKLIHFDVISPLKTIYQTIHDNLTRTKENFVTELSQAIEFKKFIYSISCNGGHDYLLPRFQHNVYALKVYFDPTDNAFPAKQSILNQSDQLIFKEKPNNTFDSTLSTLIILSNMSNATPVIQEDFDIHSNSATDLIKTYKFYVKHFYNPDRLNYNGLFLDCYLSPKIRHIIKSGRAKVIDSIVNIAFDCQADYAQSPEGLVISFSLTPEEFDHIFEKYEKLTNKIEKFLQQRINHIKHKELLNQFILKTQQKVTLDEEKDILTNDLLNYLKLQSIKSKIEIESFSRQIDELDEELQTFMNTNYPFIHSKKLLIYEPDEDNNSLKPYLFSNFSSINSAVPHITSLQIKIDYLNNRDSFYLHDLNFHLQP